MSTTRIRMLFRFCVAIILIFCVEVEDVYAGPWGGFGSGLGSGLGYISEDLTPVLGGDLDASTFGIYGAFTNLTAASATPSVAVGMNFLTANATADVAITDFTDTTTGMPFRVVIADDYTDIDFSGAALAGHGEVLLDDPAIGTMLTCVDDGTRIDCDVSEWTSMALSTFISPQGTTPAQTANGSRYWDNDTFEDTVGNGTTREVFVPTGTKTDENLCSYEATGNNIDCDTPINTLALIAGNVYTGVHDFGGATSLELPNGNNPTTDAAGEVAVDVNNVALEVFTATASRLIPTVFTKELTIPEPDKQQAILDAWPIFRADVTAFPFGITVTSCYITLSADAAYVAVFEEWTGDPPAQTADIETVTTGAGDSYMEDTSPANPTVEADNYVYVDLPTTDVPMVQVQISYTVNEGN